MVKKSAKSGATKSQAKAKTAKLLPVQTEQVREAKSSYRSFKLSKRIRHSAKLPSTWQLLMNAARTIWSRKPLFLGIAAVYGLLNLIFQGQGLLSNSDVLGIKSYFGENGGFGPGLGSFAQVFSASGSATSGAASTMQFILMIVVSLAIIWALRQVLAGQKATVKQSYYLGMTPFIPFMLVLLVIALQLIPLLVGSTLYQTIIANGIAVYPAEQVLWALLFVLLALLSLYMVASSIFALYIVTLPGMTPLAALRSARELVRYRRWTVLRKVILLPFIIFVLAAILIVPVIIWLTPLSQVVFFVFTMLSFVLVHTYMYGLYRELLNE